MSFPPLFLEVNSFWCGLSTNCLLLFFLVQLWNIAGLFSKDQLEKQYPMTTAEEPEQMKNLPWPTDEEHPRRLLRLPDGILVGFGGGDAIYQLVADDQSTVVRQWEDDAVKALAVSLDGKRVAVGFDSGMTQIYAYDSYTAPDPHPFASKAGDGTSFCTECAEAPVRNLQFHPTNDYLLAIATESALMVLDARSEESASTSNDEFAQLVAKHHDDAGIRSVDFKKSTKENKVLLSSLGMDGRHCLWDATTSEPSEWKLIHRDAAQCITKRDVGEVLGAKVWERACRPTFCNNIIILPGEAFLQLRWVQASSTVVDCDMTNTEHKDLVVVAATRGRSIVTGGRDGRVLLWRMEPGNNVSSICTSFCFCRLGPSSNSFSLHVASGGIAPSCSSPSTRSG